ncbi:DUF4382 domain-containing protein [Arachidicoccus sp.]|uniref:DUF4382 domain-containing protein n=1 Tax=Arachidicoccus sp. TaxID=1872624 RepID=UPI003D201A2E
MKKFFLFAFAFACLTWFSCSKSDTTSGSGNASAEFYLTDAPTTAYDAVNVDVQSVLIQSDQDTGWVALDIKAGIYNLMQLRNGVDTLLSRATLPAGNISQIRLVLGTNNSVVVNGQTYVLQTPSAMQSGLKFNFHQTLVANGSYKIWIDFDANKSVVQQGNGNYLLKPTIRAYSAETNGQIKGYVLPPLSTEAVLAINGTDTLSAVPASDGFFKFSGLAEGSYKIWFEPNIGFKDTTLTNVNVSFGQITDLGSTTLVQIP